MNRVTIIASDKDSSASYTETFLITKNLKNDIANFETRIPFSRYFTEHMVNDEVELSENEIEWILAAGLED